MRNKLLRIIKTYLQLPILKSDKEEFKQGINKTNAIRAKITSTTFLIIEIIILTIMLLVKKEENFNKPDIYYIAMYIIMILIMTLFLFVFIKLSKDIPKYNAWISIAGIFFMSFILLWCAGISLLDMMTGGGIIVYVMAIIAVAVTPLLNPIVLFAIYLLTQILYLLLLPVFCSAENHLFGNSINSTTIIMISWAISGMRWRNRAEDFCNRKKIQKQSEKLKKLNLELEVANQKLKILSQTDSLTGIFNRSVFDTILMREWNRGKNRKTFLSLIMIDVDLFKAYNDTYGHQAGDDCLRQVAETISECAERSSDTVVRYGGEEFAVILPDMRNETAYELAEKMRSSVESLNILHETSSISDFVTISLGVYSVIPSEEQSVDEFIRRTDKALYEAKNQCRNKVVIHQ